MYQSFYTGALGAGTCMAKMGVISNNLANINNEGFKPKTAAFTDLLNYNLNDSENAVTELMAGSGVRMQRTYSRYNVEALTPTNSAIDFAIMDENAFFMLRDPVTQQITYTRGGHFYRSQMEDGYYLMTDGGKLVLDQNGECVIPWEALAKPRWPRCRISIICLRCWRRITSRRRKRRKSLTRTRRTTAPA